MSKMLTYAFILILTAHLIKGAVILPDSLKLFNDVYVVEKYESPVIIINGGTTIVHPNNDGVEINLPVGTVVDIVCLSGALKFPNSTGEIFGTTSLESISATYVSSQQFKIDNYIISLEDVVCYESSATYSELTTQTCGYGNIGYLAEIGFTLSTSSVKTKTINVCFDETLQTPLFSYHSLSSDQKVVTSSHTWKQGINIYNLPVKVDTLYANSAQTVTSILGHAEPNYILTKGHLAPAGDFTTSAEQSTTYHYINAAPQWNVSNSINWNNLEQSIRDYGSSKSIDLQVWTGIDGVVALNNNLGLPADLYLYSQGNSQALPVPKVFWKVVYYAKDNKGVAFVGVNEPTSKNLICTDVWTTYTWLPKKRETDGYVYACLVEDLHNVIPNAPDLGTLDPLL